MTKIQTNYKIGKYNSYVINRLIKKYGVSKDFIYKSLSGVRDSETANSIIKDYSRGITEVQKVLENL